MEQLLSFVRGVPHTQNAAAEILLSRKTEKDTEQVRLLTGHLKRSFKLGELN